MEKNNMFELYDTNKNASVGTECVCPSCGTKFTKTVWQQCFCTSKPKTQCKDYYWNKKKHLLTK